MTDSDAERYLWKAGDADLLNEQYDVLKDPATEFAVIFANANFAYRVGPMSGPEVGEIIKKCAENGVPASIVVVSKTLDWVFATDLCGGLDKLHAAKAKRDIDLPPALRPGEANND